MLDRLTDMVDTMIENGEIVPNDRPEFNGEDEWYLKAKTKHLMLLKIKVLDTITPWVSEKINGLCLRRAKSIHYLLLSMIIY